MLRSDTNPYLEMIDAPHLPDQRAEFDRLGASAQNEKKVELFQVELGILPRGYAPY